MSSQHGKPILCPHCGSADVEADSGGVVIDTYPSIHYDGYACRACHQPFTVKWDDEDGVRAILTDYQPGHYYPDDGGNSTEGRGANDDG